MFEKMCEYSHCFFVVDAPTEKDEIRKLAKSLLETTCRKYDFYGSQSRVWELVFDEVDTEYHPDEDDMDIALTCRWHTYAEFLDSLKLAQESGESILLYSIAKSQREEL